MLVRFNFLICKTSTGYEDMVYKYYIELSSFGMFFPTDSLNRMGQRPLFISAIGTDSHSDAVLNYSQHMVHMQRSLGAVLCALISTLNQALSEW